MMTDLQDRDLRQREIVPPEKLAVCHALVIGVGAVGRQAALQLAAMGIERMTLIDHDQVDVVNLAAQGYAPDQMGQAKVEATAIDCHRLNPAIVVHEHPERFRRSSPRGLKCFEANDRKLVVFTCVDSITCRSLIWEVVRRQAHFYLDARISAEVVRVLASDHPDRDEHYPSTLFSQSEAYAGSCTAKSTIYTAAVAAGLMLSQFTRWLRGMPVDRDLLVNVLSSEITAV